MSEDKGFFDQTKYRNFRHFKYFKEPLAKVAKNAFFVIPAKAGIQ